MSVIDIFTKYASAVPLRNKKGVAITNMFQKCLEESGCKPNKIIVSVNNSSIVIEGERTLCSFF